MVGAKVSIVSPKVQTTRSRVRGIVVKGDCEIVLIDTPGIFKPKRRLDRAMVAAAWQDAEYSDKCLLLVDARRGLDDDTRSIVESVKKNKLKADLVLNKTDLVKRAKLAELSLKLNELYSFSETFAVSAATGDGVDVLERRLMSEMPAGPFMFPADQVSDLPDKLLAAEITREKLYMNLNQELPYVSTVQTDSFSEENGAVKINQTIYVEKNNQKQIVIGKNGSMIKKIGTQSRTELEKMFDCRVHLFLFVKVREKWEDNPEHYRSWGLDFNA